MCNFDALDEQTKDLIHLLMKKSADSVGGINFFLSLLEEMKKKKPNALMLKQTQISSDEIEIKWNKVVFKDKVDLLDSIIHSQKSQDGYGFNILENHSEKKAKKILNMVKTIAPLKFIVTPFNNDNGAGFSFKVFESIENGDVKLNPIFITIFFCSIEFVKKTLKHKI